MTGREAARRWSSWRARLRERAAHLTPRVLTTYPFEVIVALIAVLMGLPFLIGTAPPASLILLVGKVAFYGWAAGLTVGGLTVAAGLQLPERPNPHIVATGLQLVAGCLGVYALAIVAVLGAAGWTGATAYACLALVALIRATHFRRVVDIEKGARRLDKERDE